MMTKNYNRNSQLEIVDLFVPRPLKPELALGHQHGIGHWRNIE